MKREVKYLADGSIDDAGDRELRGLLSTCFTKPGDAVFKTRRFWREPYKHRWIIRSDQGTLIAHVGLHEKRIEVGGRSFAIGGICEVCVHPDFRGRGYVKAMLDCAHEWMASHEIPFSLLFGDPGVYASSGYVDVGNLLVNEDGKDWKPVKGMVKEVLDLPWPTGEVRLVGIKF